VLRGNLHGAEEEFALLNAKPAPRSLAESKNRAVGTQRAWADAFRNTIGAMEEAGIDRMTVAQGKRSWVAPERPRPAPAPGSTTP
jgi:hypothetical protein